MSTKTLAQRFYDVKTQIGGNREKSNWEYTFGMPRETQYRITLPNKYIRRTISQVEFALQLASTNTDFEQYISNALDILESDICTHGVLTKGACAKAEETLTPLATAAKEYEILLIAHAHIDMNWMWGWQETVAATLSTFRTMLALMREYPEFTFSQSQASVYKIVEDYDPAMMEEIKARIKEGRWECTATAWVETDKNMPNTESLLRHITLTREYMHNKWDIDPKSLEVDFSPDTFGHSGNIPEINAYGNVKYYYHCRGQHERQLLYRWKAPSGKEILIYCEPFWYNAAVVPEMGINAIDLANHSGGLKTSMFLYGVGNHGGGPTRKDIEQAIEMKSWPIFPKVNFGTMHQYFKKAESVRDNLPLWSEEINAIFTGCYTTQSRIKMGNRKGESALTSAESIYAVANQTTGYTYPRKNLVKAWQNVLFTHFHDIITGSTVQESREYAMGLYADSMSVANTLRENSARALIGSIDTSMIEVDTYSLDTQSEGAGVGYGIENYSGVPNPETGKGKVRIYTVFNPTPHKRKEIVEITLWDWIWDMSRLAVTDHDGNPIPFQIRDHELQNYWDHKYIRVYVEADVPALGYKTIVIKEKTMETYPVRAHDFPRAELPHGPLCLENDHLKASFSEKTGALVSLIDKKTGVEQIKPGKAGELVYVSSEAATSSAWLIGRHLGHTPVAKTLRIAHETGNELRKTITLEQRIESSKIKTIITLDKDAKALGYSFEINWEEYAKKDENVPVLIFNLPLAKSPMAYQTDTPAGYIRRQERYQDVCGLQYGAAVYDNKRALAIICDCKYGYRGAGDNLSLTLINSSDNPDPYPERGVHKINLWVAVDDSCPKALKTTADGFCYPMNYLSTGSHAGTLPPTGPLMELCATTSVFSSAGVTADGSMYVRVYETCGIDDSVTLTLPFTPTKACLVDLDENVLGEAMVSGNTVSFPVGAYCIAGVRIVR